MGTSFQVGRPGAAPEQSTEAWQVNDLSTRAKTYHVEQQQRSSIQQGQLPWIEIFYRKKEFSTGCFYYGWF
jgi:hypothetical protein